MRHVRDMHKSGKLDVETVKLEVPTGSRIDGIHASSKDRYDQALAWTPQENRDNIYEWNRPSLEALPLPVSARW